MHSNSNLPQPISPPRRNFATFVFAGYAIGFGQQARAQSPAQGQAQLSSFMERAFEMKQRAVADGDQPFGAVVVKNGRIIAESPSRVITAKNIDAHAEREAMRLARIALGSDDLAGCLLISSSRPCGLCERAAFENKVRRMIYGEALTDAGAPRTF